MMQGTIDLTVETINQLEGFPSTHTSIETQATLVVLIMRPNVIQTQQHLQVTDYSSIEQQDWLKRSEVEKLPILWWNNRIGCWYIPHHVCLMMLCYINLPTTFIWWCYAMKTSLIWMCMPHISFTCLAISKSLHHSLPANELQIHCPLKTI